MTGLGVAPVTLAFDTTAPREYHAPTVDIALLLVVALIVVLIWRGPKMLPRIGQAFGKTVKGVRENVPGALRNDTSESSDSSNSSDPGDKSGS